jgi:hypothetical protein
MLYANVGSLDAKWVPLMYGKQAESISGLCKTDKWNAMYVDGAKLPMLLGFDIEDIGSGNVEFGR